MKPAAPPAEQIRAHLARVAHLREQARSGDAAQAVREVKVLQARRFEATYADLMCDPRCGPATRFFLDELYGDHDFRQRDAQFARIAGAIERLFPAPVAELAVDMAELHALTEQLDATLAAHWARMAPRPAAERYVLAWRQTGERALREQQLQVVQHMGRELQALTRKASLRLGLRMMRGAAQAAGLGALQGFLEKGFDAFGQMGRHTEAFLGAIAERESAWIGDLFDAPDATARLARQIGG
ncbi:FFLEELY motif protein [Hydrogenophaga sp. OTU3427]|uniref:FFLEELY motif protein n=1 Tax=Hydrogenophaga sp. OTU3427 TaxID=3043856 RepID=UPI00313BE97C